jgi:polyisoprenyl-phosphate glycosyltransferase
MYNEAENARPMYHALTKVFQDIPYDFEMLFVDDGSKDDTNDHLMDLAEKDERVRPIELARNFGKEVALSAGLHNAQGEMAIMLDADLQHPPELIPEFIEKWEEGADLVIGVRKDYKVPWFKRQCSKLFYLLINKLSDTDIVPHATDFRLVDRQVINSFNLFTERNRITRGLFDWLGYKRNFIYFETRERANGAPTYSFRKLIQLAINSLVGHTIFPLRIAGYVGGLIITISLPLALFIFLDRYILMNPFGFNFSASAILAVINLFFSGLILSSLGLMSLYLANMHTEITNRPLYVKRPQVRMPKAAKKGTAKREDSLAHMERQTTSTRRRGGSRLVGARQAPSRGRA